MPPHSRKDSRGSVRVRSPPPRADFSIVAAGVGVGVELVMERAGAVVGIGGRRQREAGAESREKQIDWKVALAWLHSDCVQEEN